MMHIWPGKDLFELWAIHKPFKGEAYRTKVAVFFTEESAGEYIRKSRLKKPMWDSAFRKKSLLSGAISAEIEECEAVEIEPYI
jgi:hypothetical protein